MSISVDESTVEVTVSDQRVDINICENVVEVIAGDSGPQGPAGDTGDAGQSAYELWLLEGNVGTEQDFLDSLVGPQGPEGPQGPQGPAGNAEGTPLNIANTIVERDSEQSFDITAIDFDTTDTIADAIGRLRWNADRGTLNLGLSANATLQLGQEEHVYVRNDSNAIITDGTVVVANGVQQDNITVIPGIANGTVDGMYFLGIATEDIPKNGYGRVTTFGEIHGQDTHAWPVGTVLWASPTTAGKLTSTKPSAPNLKLPIAFVTRSHPNDGTILVRMTNGSSLGGTDSNVEFTPTISDHDVVSYDSATKIWVNKSLTTLISEVGGIDATTLDGRDSTYFIDTSSTTQTKSGSLVLGGTGTMDTLDLVETQITSKVTTIHVTTPVLIDSFAASSYRSAEYILQFSQGTNYSISKFLLIHNGSDLAITEYGQVSIGSNIPYDFSGSFALGNLEVTISCNNANVTPVDFKFSRVLFDA